MNKRLVKLIKEAEAAISDDAASPDQTIQPAAQPVGTLQANVPGVVQQPVQYPPRAPGQYDPNVMVTGSPTIGSNVVDAAQTVLQATQNPTEVSTGDEPTEEVEVSQEEQQVIEAFRKFKAKKLKEGVSVDSKLLKVLTYLKQKTISEGGSIADASFELGAAFAATFGWNNLDRAAVLKLFDEKFQTAFKDGLFTQVKY